MRQGCIRHSTRQPVILNGLNPKGDCERCLLTNPLSGYRPLFTDSAILQSYKKIVTLQRIPFSNLQSTQRVSLGILKIRKLPDYGANQGFTTVPQKRRSKMKTSIIRDILISLKKSPFYFLMTREEKRAEISLILSLYY